VLFDDFAEATTGKAPLRWIPIIGCVWKSKFPVPEIFSDHPLFIPLRLERVENLVEPPVLPRVRMNFLSAIQVLRVAEVASSQGASFNPKSTSLKNWVDFAML